MNVIRQSGIGLPHSKTLSRSQMCDCFRKVVECGSPMPLFSARRIAATLCRFSVGGWPFGYASWRLDLTSSVKPGGDNVLVIRLDNPPNSSRWYPSGGIYRNVWLVKTSPVIATDNGDPTSFEPFQSRDRYAFNGLRLAIVRGMPGTPGKLTLTATADGLRIGKSVVTSK